MPQKGTLEVHTPYKCPRCSYQMANFISIIAGLITPYWSDQIPSCLRSWSTLRPSYYTNWTVSRGSVMRWVARQDEQQASANIWHTANADWLNMERDLTVSLSLSFDISVGCANYRENQIHVYTHHRQNADWSDSGNHPQVAALVRTKTDN